MDMSNHDLAAERFAALGNPARLAVLRLLVKAGNSGMMVGEIQRQLAMPASTVAHHLRTLVQAGIVLQQRQGREVWCRAAYPVLTGLGDYLLEECCSHGGCN
ncbi:MAG: metalloregulator ArsR/SmtB family transcription factor [Wenzhouxiangellaceae bacterium]